MIYADANATTPIHPRVREAMLEAMGWFGNPSSLHALGRQADQAIEKARRRILDFVHAPEGSRVIFTGSGTEANQLALFSAMARLAADKRDLFLESSRILSTSVEHPSIIDAFGFRGMNKAESLLPVDPSTGQVRVDRVDPDTEIEFLSVQAANNETGVIQRGVVDGYVCDLEPNLFHVDAVQAAGKIDVDMAGWDADMITIAAHKIGGPKGVGALICTEEVAKGAIEPVIPGSQENGLRAGTENVIGIVGFGMACKIATTGPPDVRDYFEEQLKKRVPSCLPLFSRWDDGQTRLIVDRVPNTSLVLFPGFLGRRLVLDLDEDGICVSTGSACHADKVEASHVLMALGFSHEEAMSAVRVSFLPSASCEQADCIVAALGKSADTAKRWNP